MAPVRPALVVLAAAAMAGVPLLTLVVLVVSGAAQPVPALVGMLVVTCAAMVIATAWAGDHAGLLHRLRVAEPGEEPMQLGPNKHIMGEISRLVRTFNERQTALERRLQTEQAIVEALPDPMIVFAADHSVLRTNVAARAAFGSDMPAVLRHPGLRGAVDRTLALGTVQTAELSLPVPVTQDVYATVFALAEDGDRIAAVLSNRTRERAIERMRADFVANASHELRTPLASLIGFIDTLRGPAADDVPAQARFLHIMAEQAQRMNRLIDDLLSLSRIELTEHQTPGGTVALCELVRWMVTTFEPQVIARGIRLEVSAPGDLPPVPGDEEQLTQVLQNLLDNAVKYGRDGGSVRVAVARCEPEFDPRGGRWPARPGVTLTVADDGPGIPREHLPRLTERFYRVNRGRSRAVGGTGLGLAIVKHIVNRHRGILAIESEEGSGATFTVWLPLTRSTSLDKARRVAG